MPTASSEYIAKSSGCAIRNMSERDTSDTASAKTRVHTNLRRQWVRTPDYIQTA